MNYHTPKVALPLVKVPHRIAPKAFKKLASRHAPKARQALILDYLLACPPQRPPADVASKIGDHGDWRVPGVLAMAETLGMSTGAVLRNILALRQAGLVEGYRVQHIGPTEAYLRITDVQRAWAFINEHAEDVRKLQEA